MARTVPKTADNLDVAIFILRRSLFRLSVNLAPQLTVFEAYYSPGNMHKARSLSSQWRIRHTNNPLEIHLSDGSLIVLFILWMVFLGIMETKETTLLVGKKRYEPITNNKTEAAAKK